MVSENLYELDLLEQEESAQEKTNKGRGRQRKWREIENIKEQRRFRRELAEYEYIYH